MSPAVIALIIVGFLAAVLALIGLLSVVRGTPVRLVMPFGLAELPPVTDPAFCATMELVSRTALVKGNAVEVFWNGDQTYPRMWEDLRAAKRSITLQLYYNKPGRMADMLSEILIAKAKAGV